MKKLLWFLIFFSFTLSADPGNEINSMDNFHTADQESLATVNGCVNAITGSFFLVEPDLIVDGPQPLSFIRYYDTGHLVDSIYGFGFGTQYPLRMRRFWEGGKHFHAAVETHEGACLEYVGDIKNDCCSLCVDDKIYEKGASNYSDFGISAHTNLKNLQLVWKKGEDCLLKYPNGLSRRYKPMLIENEAIGGLLTLEQHPNGNRTHYTCSLDALRTSYLDGFEEIYNTSGIKDKKLNSIKFSYTSEGYIVTGSNGQSVTYTAPKEWHKLKIFDGYIKRQSFILKEVSAPHLPTTLYRLDATGKNEGFRKIGQVEKPEGRILSISYDEKERVKSLYAPVGATNKLLTAFTFTYGTSQTSVINAQGALTVYLFSKNKLLQSIERYNGKAFYSSKEFCWDRDHFLKAKAICNDRRQAGRAIVFEYDDRGNILKENFYGNLTGKGPDLFDFSADTIQAEVNTKYYTYSTDGLNLRLSERDDCGFKTLYFYKPETNLLTKKLIYHRGKIHERVFYEYDENAVLIKTKEDDGGEEDGGSVCKITTITPKYDHLPSIGKPEVIRESYIDGGSEHLLQLTKFDYTEHGFPRKKEVYDADMNYCYAEIFEYDERDLIVKEIDPLGQETVYDYDANHNKIYEEKVGSGKKTAFSYDFMNRLIQVEDTYEDGIVFTTKHEYDLVGNRIATTDPFGNKTVYKYDTLNRLVEVRYPPVQNGVEPVQKYDHDFLNRVIGETDERGFKTETKYNSYDQPIEINHPDGTTERFEYTLNGWLRNKWDQEGGRTEYDHDPDGRIIREAKYDGGLIEEITRRYKGKQLVAETDFAGITTYYKYDGAGRKISEVRKDRKTTFAYDSLGRLRAETNHLKEGARIEITEYDFLNRPIEKRTKDHLGKVYRKESIAYDRNGNKTEVCAYVSDEESAVSRFEYNPRNEPVKEIDPLGNVINYRYNYAFKNELGQIVCQKVTIDPLNGRQVEVYDTLKRLVSMEKQSRKRKTMAKSEFAYDPKGNKIEQKELVFENGEHARDYVIKWTYDPMGRSEKVVEEGKVTGYSYYPTGRLRTLTKPDGVAIEHTYYGNGLLKAKGSSDKSISYFYEYDANHNLVKITDKLTKQTTLRSYNDNDELISETLGNGLTTKYCYDQFGRVVEVTLPDDTIIKYVYDAAHLIGVTYRKSGRVVYKETYEDFDYFGQPARRCIGPTTIDLSWDKLGRRVKASSAIWSESLDKFDAKGNLLGWQFQDERGIVLNRYAYDPLDQLISENEHKYNYDSIYNRLKKDDQDYTLNVLNQVENDLKAVYEYDLNGNLTKRREGEVEQIFTYDALNRLTSVITPKGLIRYKYDSIGRCLRKETETEAVDYFYQFDTEIGAVERGTVKELKVLGLSKGFKTGPAAAIQLDGEIYAAISDHVGSIRVLLDGAKSVAQTYRYSAFGEREPLGELECPWGFNNKRLDMETNLIRFLKRDYSPDLGRFLSTDPLLFEDGPNLYAYVHNNPLIFEDPFGLYQVPNNFSDLSTSFLSSPQFQGSMQAFAGFSEFAAGSALTLGSQGLAGGIGWPIMIHGLDQMFTGVQTAFSGVPRDTVTSQMLQKGGVPANIASFADDTMTMCATWGGPFLLTKSPISSGIGKSINGGMVGGAGTERLAVNSGAENINAAIYLKRKLTALEIAGGHAFEKHAAEFGFKTTEQMAMHIEKVLANPSMVSPLSRGRIAYWHKETGSIVIRNSKAVDGGTTFIPKRGFQYFLEELN